MEKHMSKFKVGDKVRGTVYGRMAYAFTTDDMTLGVVVEPEKLLPGDDMRVKVVEHTDKSRIGCDFSVKSKYFELIEPRREFIAIHRDGNVMTAERRANREVIKSAKATCNASDTFDFDTGAKLAFDRLMGREEPKRAPQPAHKFKVGDRVVVDGAHDGEISAISTIAEDGEPYLVYCLDNGIHSGSVKYGAVCKPEHAGKCLWSSEYVLSPAPEPPKLYTGKVVCIEDNYIKEQNRVGMLFEFKDGYLVGDNSKLDPYGSPRYKSFEHFQMNRNTSKWIEIKE